MDILDAIQTSPVLFQTLVTLLGLCVGSFLNVIIYRLPLRMEQEWRNECIDFLKLSPAPPRSIPSNIWTSRSSCPHCKTRLRLRDNIPVLSYLFLGGKCAHCQQKISIQYPLVEISCALLSLAVAIHFGYSWQTVAGLIFTWLLITMSGIDIKHQILPDVLTYIGIWIGLLLSLSPLFVDSHSAIIGGLAGYLSLWTIANLFKLLTQKDGMGYGDFKLFALLGVWLGWQMLIFIILVAAFLGSLIGLALILFKGSSRDTPIPFGPFLALAGWIALIWGNAWISPYFTLLS